MRPASLRIDSLEDRTVPASVATGTVFTDFNRNGILDAGSTLPNAGTGTVSLANDIGVAGVTVTAYDGTNVIRGQTTTIANGTYILNASGTGPYRIEFTGAPVVGTTAPNVGGSRTTVRFIADGVTVTANQGLTLARDFSQNVPPIVTSQYAFGNQITGTNANDPVIVSRPYTAGTQDSDPTLANYSATSAGTTLAVPANQVGSTWGLGYDPQGANLYAAAFFKRHSGFGPGGPGAVYRIGVTPAGGQAAPATVLADLNALFPADVPAGANLHDNNDYDRDNDNIGYNAVGKTGLGGLDVSEDGRFVYVMALADRRLYAIPTSGPVNATTVRRIDIPIVPGVTGATAGNPRGDERPFAVQVQNGRIYIGVVNSAETTQNAADVRAFVYEVTDTGTALTVGATPVLNVALNYPRGIVNGTTVPAAWNAWSPVFRTVNLLENNNFEYPQPMLTGLAFDTVGNLTLGLRDRNGDQGGYQTLSRPDLLAVRQNAVSAGDTLRATVNNPANPSLGFTLENNGNGPTGEGVGNEFYFADNLPRPQPAARPNFHDEVSSGGVAQLAGTDNVVSTVFDPARILPTDPNNPDTFDRGGFRFFNSVTGANDKGYELYQTIFVAGQPADTFGKANGLGDVTFLRARADIEIGNRVFSDLNGDGIQGAAEVGIAGIRVNLLDGTGATVLATAVTDANGEYYFRSGTEANANDNVGLVAGAGILPATNFRLQVLGNQALLTNLVPTQTTVASGADSALRDSDLVRSGADGIVNLTTGAIGESNHSFDLGYAPSQTLGNRVFRDGNNNGAFDAGETGIDGVTLRLFAADLATARAYGASALTTEVVPSVTTAGGGYYLFRNLSPGNYIVRADVPTGFTSSTGQNGSLAGPFEPFVGNPSTSDNDDSGTLLPGNTQVATTTISLLPGLSPTNEVDIQNPNPDAATPNANSNLNIDFGFFRPASLGDLVFRDINANAIRDAGEPGVSGVVVLLYATADLNTPISTATTDPNGSYTFTNLAAGSYTVRFNPVTLPAGSSFTVKNAAGSTTANDSDANPNGFTDPVVLTEGQNDPTVDAGIVGPIVPPVGPLSSIAGQVYEDLNDNGIRDPNEVPISRTTVLLTGTDNAGRRVSLTAITDSNGNYLFPNLVAGTYTVREIQPQNFFDGRDTLGTSGGTQTDDRFSAIVLPAGTAATAYNFGEYPESSVGGNVYIDLNRNGEKDPGEPPIGGVTVTLTGTDNLGRSISRSLTTDPDGSYLFGGLRPGSYSLTESQPARFAQGATTVGTQGGSSVNDAISLTLGLRQAGRVNDFGEVTTADNVTKQDFLSIAPESDSGIAATSPNFANSSGTTGLGGSVAASRLVAVGSLAGVPARVNVYDFQSNQLRFSLSPFGSFAGGVSLATGDVDGDGFEDVIVGAGPGGGPNVKVFDGRTGAEIRSFFAYGPSMPLGVNVAVADINGDGRADIITGAGPGGGSHVRVFDGGTSAEVRSFFAYDASFFGGVTVAGGDIDGDGFGDIITGTQIGSSHVRAFSGRTGAELFSRFAYDANYRGGVSLAAGDIDGDGRADIITGTNGDSVTHIKAFASDGSELKSFNAFDASLRTGARVAARDINGDGRADIVVSTASRSSNFVRIFNATTLGTLEAFRQVDGFGMGLTVG